MMPDWWRPWVRREPCLHLSLALPVIVVLLGLTAVQPRHGPSISDIRSIAHLRFDPIDVAANLILFVPLGIVMAHRGLRTAVLVAAATSVLAETSQLLSTTRSASVIDVVVNVAGATLGWGIARALDWDLSAILITRRRAAIAFGLAVACGVFGATTSPENIELDLRNWVRQEPEANPRGSSEAGRLEGRWTFDDDAGDDVADETGGGASGRAVGGPGFAPGVDGDALVLDGETQYVDVGDLLSFRLAGSATVAAWIRMDRFPPDDGPIASTLDVAENGFQLDTTIDSGPRVVGLKLGGANGRLMARYGATPLRPGEWYHVAGVYDASHATMHVYLDGLLDDGCLSGSVTSSQRPSTAGLLLGGRPDLPTYRFSGMLDDVRVYSRALSSAEIATIASDGGERAEHAAALDPGAGRCVPAPDSRSGGLMVAIGSLIAFAALGLVGFRGHPLIVGGLASCAAGLVLWSTFDGAVSNAAVGWTPVLAVVGGAAVGLSARRPHPPQGRFFGRGGRA